MARQTRQQTQARTREELLATATEHFLDRGYSAASLEQIAEDAGYSKGAVYSNFRNKDELCFAVLDRIRAERMGEIAATLEAGASLDDVVAAFGAWAERTIGDRRWTLLEIEFSVRSRHDEEIRSRIAAGAAGVRTLIAELIRSLAARFGLEPAIETRAGGDDAARARHRPRPAARDHPRPAGRGPHRRRAGSAGSGAVNGSIRYRAW